MYKKIQIRDVPEGACKICGGTEFWPYCLDPDDDREDAMCCANCGRVTVVKKDVDS